MAAIAEHTARRASLRTDALLAELRALIARHTGRDETTAIDGVLLSAARRPGETRASTSGTIMAIIAQDAKRVGPRRSRVRLRPRPVRDLKPGTPRRAL